MKTFTKEITLDSQSSDGICDQIEVEFSIIADNEDDAYYQVDQIWNKTISKDIELSSLPKEDVKKIEKLGDDLAYENGWEVWHDDQISRAEAYADSLEDR